MTKKETFIAIREVVKDNQEFVDFINHEIELLEKKTTNRKPTAKQLENAAYKEKVVAYFDTVGDVPKNIKEVIEENPEFADLSTQRVARILNDLVEANILKKEYVKKVPYFAKVTE